MQILMLGWLYVAYLANIQTRMALPKGQRMQQANARWFSTHIAQIEFIYNMHRDSQTREAEIINRLPRKQLKWVKNYKSMIYWTREGHIRLSKRAWCLVKL